MAAIFAAVFINLLGLFRNGFLARSGCILMSFLCGILTSLSTICCKPVSRMKKWECRQLHSQNSLHTGWNRCRKQMRIYPNLDVEYLQ